MGWGRIAFVSAVFLIALARDARSVFVHAQSDLGIDFGVFQRTLTVPIGEIYKDLGHMPFIYPPTAILPFQAAGSLPYAGWAALSALLFAIAVARVTDLRLTSLAFVSPSAVKGLVLGQSPMALAAGLFAGVTLSPIAAGALWGVVAAIKPQLMLFAPIALLVRRDWPMLGGMAAGGLVMILLSLAVFGFTPWQDWLAAISRFSELAAEGVATKGITPAGIAARAGYPILPFLLAGAALGLAAVLRCARKVEKELLIALIVAASIVASPYAHAHDTIAIIPACVALMLRGHWIVAVPAGLTFIGSPFLTMAGLMAGLAIAALWRTAVTRPAELGGERAGR